MVDTRNGDNDDDVDCCVAAVVVTWETSDGIASDGAAMVAEPEMLLSPGPHWGG